MEEATALHGEWVESVTVCAVLDGGEGTGSTITSSERLCENHENPVGALGAVDREAAVAVILVILAKGGEVIPDKLKVAPGAVSSIIRGQDQLPNSKPTSREI